MFRQKAPEFQKRRFRYFWIRTDRNHLIERFFFGEIQCDFQRFRSVYVLDAHRVEVF